MDYASLRQEGIRQLERLSGGLWTDFNAVDPGITLLEQLCYVLTDLGYRTAHDIPDLLAEGGNDPYESIHLPEDILTCRPVTPADLRRLVLDVEGVQNAWVEPLGEDAPTLYYDPTPKTLGLKAPEPSSMAKPVKLNGLYRVLIDSTSTVQRGQLRAAVARRLLENRGLCEDFAEITVLAAQPITVEATVEIGPVDDAGRLEGEIWQKIADVISPPIQWRTLDEMLRASLPLDAIFDGPRLDHGFLPDEALERATRRVAINTSDILRAIGDLPDVRAVSRVEISAEGERSAWSLAVAPTHVAKLDRLTSTITLRRGGKNVAGTTPVAGTTRKDLSPASAGPAPSGGRLALPAGRDRHVGAYTTVQQELPAIYGVGHLGLPASAPPERRARARQLRAYLMFFEQIMANHLAQLAHMKDLFSHQRTSTSTYFAQPVQQPGPASPVLVTGHDEHNALKESLAGGRRSHSSYSTVDEERKNRFLDHLLARFAETLDDHGTASPDTAASPPSLVERKQDFLRDHVRLGGGRSTAFNYLKPAGPTNRSALEQRIQLKLGLTMEETPILVEHILLRPMDDSAEDGSQKGPLLAGSMTEDPYSLQLTFVLPFGVGRFPTDAGHPNDFGTLVEQTIREETPAHLTVYVRWMESTEWETFQGTHDDQGAHYEWLEQRRICWATKWGTGRKEEA